MSRIRRQGILCIVCLGVLNISVPGKAQPVVSTGDVHGQLFSRVEQTTVALAQAFAVEIELYASPVSPEGFEQVREAFEAGRFSEALAGLNVVRWEAPVVLEPGGAAEPMVLRRTVILRALQLGPLQLPAFEVHLANQTLATVPVALMVFEVTPAFFQGRNAVFPIVAEGKDDRGRPHVRAGSAFLIAPDMVATSLHVVLDARLVRLMLPGGKEVVTRKIWMADPMRDVALLYVNPEVIRASGLHPLRLAPVGNLLAMSTLDPHNKVVFTMGWPGGTQHITAGLQYQGATLQPGERLWISANPVRPGDSGGPLLDRHGRVLGVISAGTVGGSRSDVLREEVSLSFDPRPALAERLLVQRPRSLRALMRDSRFNMQPHVQAIRLTSQLVEGQRFDAGVAESLALLEATLPDEPASARLHFLQGMIYQLLGTRGQAAASYRASLAVYEGNFMSSYMLGLHYLRLEEYREAEQLFRHTRRYRPYYHFASHGLARALMGRHRYAEAVPLLREVIAHDTEYAPALYDLALCALALDDEPRARQLLAKLETISPLQAGRLRRVLHEPALRPHHVKALPRAELARPASSLHERMD